MSVRTAAVLLAAGAGTRVGAGVNKVLLDLDGIPVLARSVRTVLDVAGVHRVVLVCRPGETDAVREAVAPHLGAHDLWVVEGGAERHDSEWQALRVLAPDVERGEIDVVAVHDAARPLADVDLWRRTIEEAAEHGAAIPVVAVPRLSARDGSRTLAGLVGVQTPQAFRAGPLLEAHTRAHAEGFRGTDTAAVLARYTDLPVVAVPGAARNLKVTFPEDLALARELLSRAGPPAGPS
ncbi:MAG: 4-diphosphocytidyl-2C-methyl-D-erythritol synthase [Marmoricola sp.]|nr:4-diphosphocytidyl-2C-methyl-D-erythritol synthase [Marmoricola sp.]